MIDTFEDIPTSEDDYIPKNPVTHSELHEIANRLISFPQICEVWKFGESADCASSAMANLLLIVKDEKLYQAFLSEMRKLMTEYSQSLISEESQRSCVIAKVLGELEFFEFLDGLDIEMDHHDLSLQLNLFILPSDWENRLEQIEVSLNQFPSDFMFKLKKEARVIKKKVV